MRKRFVTTILSSLLTVACVFGFTACGGENNNEVPKGEQVTEEQWKSAFKATVNSVNYTVDIMANMHMTRKFFSEEGKEVTYTETTNGSMTTYVNSDKVYSKSTLKGKVEEQPLFDSGNYEVEETDEEYYELEGTDLWNGYLHTQKYISGAPEDYVERAAEWFAKNKNVEAVSMTEILKGSDLLAIGMLETPTFATSEDSAEYKHLIDLFSAFTYSDDKYSATLYVNPSDSSFGLGETIVEISIKDGYIVGFGLTVNNKVTSEEGSYEIKGTTSFSFKDYNKTTVNAPAGAVEAINKAKADK